MLFFIAYNLMLVSVFPLLLFWAIWRLVKGKSRQGWRQRLGLLKELGKKNNDHPTDPPKRIWVHACSVGEVNAVRPVIRHLRQQMPDAIIYVSTITPTGQIQARRSCLEANAIFYFPFDIIPCMLLALCYLKPDLCILTEKELWPNFLGLCQMLRIPVLVVNGVISDRTSSRAEWARGFVRWLVNMASFFSVQTEQYQQRLLALGVVPEKIAVDGNTKFDQPMPEPGKEAALARALGWKSDTILLVAGSTHAGEDEVVLEAFIRLKQSNLNARLLIAPRHPERTPAVAEAIEKVKLQWVRRSMLQDSSCPDAVVILDTIGELSLSYRLAKAAFVGGSLVSHVGGHNPLEVIAEGKPVFFGPYMRSCRDIAALLEAEKVGFTINTADDLFYGWRQALTDHEWLSRIKQRAQEVMYRHRGGSDRAASRAIGLLSGVQPVVTDMIDVSKEGSRVELSLQPTPHNSTRRDSKQYLLDVIENRRVGALPDILRTGLHGLSYVYHAGLAANLAMYHTRILKKKKLSCPVISIGNITLGGTGKTLATAALCQWLIEKGIMPAVLSRGYGGSGENGGVVFDGEKLLLGPAEAGDEPFLLAASFPDARVVIGKNRCHSAEIALELGAEIMLLDDGFQYWKLEKDYEIVLVDALHPLGNGHLFPRGLLREPLSALQRAHTVWITHADLVSHEQLANIEDAIFDVVPDMEITHTIHQPVALRDFSTGDRIGLWALEGKRVLVLSGIGNPYSFEMMIGKMGASVVPARFTDHHRFQQEELQALFDDMPKDIGMIVTTAKDAVRLPANLQARCPIRVVDVRLAQRCGNTVIEIESVLDELFREVLVDE